MRCSGLIAPRLDLSFIASIVIKALHAAVKNAHLFCTKQVSSARQSFGYIQTTTSPLYQTKQ